MTTRSSRWITVRTPFDYTWPSRAITHYSEPGDQLVKDDVADFAVANGYATEGKADGSARSRKGGKGKRVRRARKGSPAAKAADTRAVPPVGDEGAADADRAADRPTVDPDAG